MLAGILGGLKAALGAISSLLGAAVRWAAIGFAYFTGRRSAQRQQAQDNLEREDEARRSRDESRRDPDRRERLRDKWR